jgi:hypothetical protein
VCNSYVLISIPPFFSFLPLVSRPSYLYIFCCLYSVIFFSLFVFLQYCARVYIYIYKYLFVPCLHSRMIFCVFPGKICFLNNRICTMFIYYLFVCRVVHQFFLFFFLCACFHLSITQTERRQRRKIIDSFRCVCVRVYECISI